MVHHTLWVLFIRWWSCNVCSTLLQLFRNFPVVTTSTLVGHIPESIPSAKDVQIWRCPTLESRRCLFWPAVRWKGRARDWNSRHTTPSRRRQRRPAHDEKQFANQREKLFFRRVLLLFICQALVVADSLVPKAIRQQTTSFRQRPRVWYESSNSVDLVPEELSKISRDEFLIYGDGFPGMGSSYAGNVLVVKFAGKGYETTRENVCSWGRTRGSHDIYWSFVVMRLEYLRNTSILQFKKKFDQFGKNHSQFKIFLEPTKSQLSQITINNKAITVANHFYHPPRVGPNILSYIFQTS